MVSSATPPPSRLQILDRMEFIAATVAADYAIVLAIRISPVAAEVFAGGTIDA